MIERRAREVAVDRLRRGDVDRLRRDEVSRLRHPFRAEGAGLPSVGTVAFCELGCVSAAHSVPIRRRQLARA